MIYFTQLIYLSPGQEAVFQAFEELVLPLIPKYKGELMLRLRPNEDAFIANSIEQPYEIHLVCFESREHFDRYMKDETRRDFLYLKEQSISSSLLIKGEKV